MGAFSMDSSETGIRKFIRSCDWEAKHLPITKYTGHIQIKLLPPCHHLESQNKVLFQNIFNFQIMVYRG